MAMTNVYPLPTEEVYIAGLDWKFDWSMKDVRRVEKMWKDGFHISDISKTVKRDMDEVAILIMDRVKKGKIKKRAGGVLGEH